MSGRSGVGARAKGERRAKDSVRTAAISKFLASQRSAFLKTLPKEHRQDKHVRRNELLRLARQKFAALPAVEQAAYIEASGKQLLSTQDIRPGHEPRRVPLRRLRCKQPAHTPPPSPVRPEPAEEVAKPQKVATPVVAEAPSLQKAERFLNPLEKEMWTCALPLCVRMFGLVHGTAAISKGFQYVEGPSRRGPARIIAAAAVTLGAKFAVPAVTAEEVSMLRVKVGGGADNVEEIRIMECRLLQDSFVYDGES
jgi:hypothetical protein